MQNLSGSKIKRNVLLSLLNKYVYFIYERKWNMICFFLRKKRKDNFIDIEFILIIYHIHKLILKKIS